MSMSDLATKRGECRAIQGAQTATRLIRATVPPSLLRQPIDWHLHEGKCHAVFTLSPPPRGCAAAAPDGCRGSAAKL